MRALFDQIELNRNWARKIAEDPRSSAALLSQLSDSADPRIRVAVAEHKNTPLKMVLEIAADVDLDVRFAMAENHNMAPSVLAFLATDTNPFVADRAQRTIERVAASATDRLAAPVMVGYESLIMPMPTLRKPRKPRTS